MPAEAILDTKLVAHHDPKSPASESYRILRTNLQFLGLDKPIKSMVLTSAGPGEGKSLTCANLAVVTAQTGAKTILVDADLRRPTLYKLFGIRAPFGLTHVLTGRRLLTDCLEPTGVDNLKILGPGPLPPNPSELLGSNRMKALIEELSAEADFIIFDTPPVLAVTDPAVLSTLVDGVVLVARSGRVAHQMAQKAKMNLLNVKARILGVVLSAIPMNGPDTYYYYYYGHGHGERYQRR